MHLFRWQSPGPWVDPLRWNIETGEQPMLLVFICSSALFLFAFFLSLFASIRALWQAITITYACSIIVVHHDLSGQESNKGRAGNLGVLTPKCSEGRRDRPSASYLLIESSWSALELQLLEDSVIHFLFVNTPVRDALPSSVAALEHSEGQKLEKSEVPHSLCPFMDSSMRAADHRLGGPSWESQIQRNLVSSIFLTGAFGHHTLIAAQEMLEMGSEFLWGLGTSS